MKSVIELDIDASPSTVAALFDDARTFPRWMDELKQVEPIGGGGESPGSKFRLVPKEGTLEFVATVVARDPPHWSRLMLDAPNVSVSVKGTFVRVADEKTKLVSEEEFAFKGLLGRLMGFFGRRGITRAHRRHMDSFKRLVESRT